MRMRIGWGLGAVLVLLGPVVYLVGQRPSQVGGNGEEWIGVASGELDPDRMHEQPSDIEVMPLLSSRQARAVKRLESTWIVKLDPAEVAGLVQNPSTASPVGIPFLVRCVHVKKAREPQPALVSAKVDDYCLWMSYVMDEGDTLVKSPVVVYLSGQPRLEVILREIYSPNGDLAKMLGDLEREQVNRVPPEKPVGQ